ncbi:MAG: NAD(P)/FAD-dependent oxidoreductase [bacterium]
MPVSKNKDFDIAVIGGGPSGMMAAGRAAELGAKVVLIERNEKPGRKLLLTGKGRCNITQAEFNKLILADKYGSQGKFLLSPFSLFGPAEVINFFKEKGLATKIERGQRVFPQSDKALDVLKTLLTWLEKGGVTIMNETEVISLRKENNKIARILIKEGGEIRADNYILCSGGKSYPQAGSTGEGYRWAEQLGHSVTKLSPALVPFNIKEKWVKDLQGLTLKNVALTVFSDDKKVSSRQGEVLFTHFGLSGPIVLDMSREVGELLEKHKVKLFLDLKPSLDFAKLDKRIQRDFEKYQNKLFRNSLTDLLPAKMVPVIVEFSGIKDKKCVREITREERHKLVKLFKAMEMTVIDLLGFPRAIITHGGVNLKEIDSKTMKSKLIDNLFFAGEVIDLDGPTGGYNLQLSWSTGYVAGQSAARNVS